MPPWALLRLKPFLQQLHLLVSVWTGGRPGMHDPYIAHPAMISPALALAGSGPCWPPFEWDNPSSDHLVDRAMHLLQAKVGELEETVSQLTTRIAELMSEKAALDSRVGILNRVLRMREEHIETLQRKGATSVRHPSLISPLGGRLYAAPAVPP